MNNREWGPTGVSRTGTGLGPIDKEHLQTIVIAHGIDAQSIGPFLAEIDQAIGCYRGAQQIHADTLPSKVRTNLEQAQQAALKLNDRINELDGLSRQLLCEQDLNALKTIYDSICRVVRLLNKGRRRADAFRRGGGRFKDYPRINLAAHIAYIIRERLKVKPTMTRDGLYEEVLKIVIGALASEIQPSASVDSDEPNVRDLMRKALKVIVTAQPGGVLEFDPRVE